VLSWIRLGHIEAGRKGKGMERNRKKENPWQLQPCPKFQPLNRGWLYLWIIIPHEVMLTLRLRIFKCRKTTDNFAENLASGGTLKLFSAGGQNLKLRH